MLSILPLPVTLLEPANLAGLGALSSSVIWPLLRHRRAILAMQVAGLLLFGLHYLLLGASTAAAMCVVGAVQAAALVGLTDRRPRIAAVAATTGIALLVSLFTWNGLTSLMSQTGQVMQAIGRLQLDTQRLRLWFLVSVLFWCAHNLMVGSVFGLGSDALTISSLLVGLWRNRLPAGAGHAIPAAEPGR